MKITVDEKNKCVIATGSYKGKRVKAVARCQPEDEFDVETGKEIAKSKYKIRYEKARAEYHGWRIRQLKSLINWCYLVIADEDRIVNGLKEKIRKMENRL